MKKILIILLAGLLLMLCTAAASGEQAVDITADCGFNGSYNGSRFTLLSDGKYTSHWDSKKSRNPWIEITAPAGQPMYAVYFCLANMPDSYEIQIPGEDGEWIKYCDGDTRFYHKCYLMPEGQTKIRFYVTGNAYHVLSFNDVFVFTEGELPDWVQFWEPTPEKADIMFLVTHPDDELIFLAGAIPTYAAEQGRDVVVAYYTYSNTTRRSESLNGLWSMGVRTCPVWGNFRDSYPKGKTKVDIAYKNGGGKSAVIGWVVEQFRHYKPEVVVTQAESGEYGHPQHMMLVDAVKNAYKASPDTSAYVDSWAEYGPWQVKKLYLHLYEENQITFDWTVPLKSQGGKTGIELAENAYTYHVTQAGSGMSVTETGTQYDNRVFGLYHSQVGLDVRKDDFLENIYESPAVYDPDARSPEADRPATAKLVSDTAPAPWYADKIPALNERGYLDEGEYVYAGDSEGIYIYVNPTCKVILERKHDDAQPLTWFEAELWVDIEAGERFRTVQLDETKWEKARGQAHTNAEMHKLVFAMNDDYYTYRIGNGRHTGVEIRGGEVRFDDRYDRPLDMFPNLDTLAIYRDGSMNVFHGHEYGAEDYLAAGAVEVFSFGPYLIKDGAISEYVLTAKETKNPRCAVGMIEPGHYIAILAEGRMKQSTGVSLKQLTLLMRAKGCSVAFNMDGGQTAVFCFMGKQLNHIGAYDGKTFARQTSEVLAVGTSDLVGTVEFK